MINFLELYTRYYILKMREGSVMQDCSHDIARNEKIRNFIKLGV